MKGWEKVTVVCECVGEFGWERPQVLRLFVQKFDKQFSINITIEHFEFEFRYSWIVVVHHCLYTNLHLGMVKIHLRSKAFLWLQSFHLNSFLISTFLYFRTSETKIRRKNNKHTEPSDTVDEKETKRETRTNTSKESGTINWLKLIQMKIGYTKQNWNARHSLWLCGSERKVGVHFPATTVARLLT